MSGLPDPASDQKRRSFVILVVALAVVAAVVTFVISRGGDGEAAGSATPSSGASASTGGVTLRTACGEIAPDMALRVDALMRTAQAVRADIAVMQSQGNTEDAEQAIHVAVALENMADAERNQQGVDRATRELGQTISTIC